VKLHTASIEWDHSALRRCRTGSFDSCRPLYALPGHFSADRIPRASLTACRAGRDLEGRRSQDGINTTVNEIYGSSTPAKSSARNLAGDASTAGCVISLKSARRRTDGKARH
jgi:hypothetical protein